MIKTVRDCNGCEMCRGCNNYRRKIVVCDRCGEESKCYYFDDKHFCIDCIENLLDAVDVND